MSGASISETMAGLAVIGFAVALILITAGAGFLLLLASRAKDAVTQEHVENEVDDHLSRSGVVVRLRKYEPAGAPDRRKRGYHFKREGDDDRPPAGPD